ncbi:MAG: dynamin family protein, partial [Clostridia bacterium]
WILQSVRNSADHLIEEHQRFLHAKHAEERKALEDQLETELENADATDVDAVMQALDKVEVKILDETARVTAAQKSMEKELSSLLDNARLTYYSTNEAAERYLESRRSNFKVGLLFAGKKTEEEKAAREQALLADLREKVSANLDFHFKELLTRLPQEYGIRDDAYHQRVHDVQIEITPALLASQIKDGAGSREYVMNYCQDISNAIKGLYRREGLELIEELCKQLSARLASETAVLSEQAEQLRRLAKAHKGLAALAEQEQAAGERLRAILE